MPLDFDPSQSGSKAVRVLALVARLLLGLIFTVFGANGFFHFLGQGGPPPGSTAAEVFGAFIHSGYLMTLIFGTQLISGLLLLAGLLVPLALALLAPLLVNILCFHLFLMPGLGPMAPGLVCTLLEIILVWAYRKSFASMLAPRAVPG